MKVVILTKDTFINGRMRVKGEVISTSENIGKVLRSNLDRDNLAKTSIYEAVKKGSYEAPKDQLPDKI